MKFGNEIRDIILEGVELEKKYNRELFKDGNIIGLSADYVNQYVEYVTDRRLEELGLESEFGAENPAKWMAELDTHQLVNFFESQNVSYEVDTRATEDEAKGDTKE